MWVDSLDTRYYFSIMTTQHPVNPTTVKLTDELKERIAPLARVAGQTQHAWMVAALERQAALAELREQFIEEAEASAAAVDGGGTLYAAEDVHAYIAARAVSIAGKKPSRPKPLKRRRA